MAHLITGFDLARIGALAVYLDDGTNAGLMQTSASGGTFCHTDISSVLSGYTALDAALLAVDEHWLEPRRTGRLGRPEPGRSVVTVVRRVSP